MIKNYKMLYITISICSSSARNFDVQHLEKDGMAKTHCPLLTRNKFSLRCNGGHRIKDQLQPYWKPKMQSGHLEKI